MHTPRLPAVGSTRLGVLGFLVNLTSLMYVLAVWSLSGIQFVSRGVMIIALLLVLLTALRALVEGRLPLPRYWYLPILFVVWLSVSLLWKLPSFEGALFFVVYTAASVLGGLAVWVAVARGLPWKWLGWVVTVGAIVLVASTYGRFQEVGPTLRITGFFINPNNFALAMFFAAYVIWCCSEHTPLPLSFFAIGLVGFSLAFTGSKVGLLAVFPTLLLAAFRVWTGRKRRSIRAQLLVAVVATAVALPWLAAGSWRWVETTATYQRTAMAVEGQQESGVDLRVELIRQGFDLWRRSPIVGHGTDQFRELSPEGFYSHCNYTELLANNGIIGFLLYYGFQVPIFVRGVRGAWRGSRPHQSALAIVLLLGITDTAWVSYFDRMVWILLPLAASLAMRPLPQQSLPWRERPYPSLSLPTHAKA